MTPDVYYGAPYWPGGYPGLGGYPLGGYPSGLIPGAPPPGGPCPPGYKLAWPRVGPGPRYDGFHPMMHVPCVPIGVAPAPHVGDIPMMYPGAGNYLVQAWEHGVVRTSFYVETAQKAYDQAKYLLDTWPWKLTAQWTSGGVVRVTGPLPNQYRLAPQQHGLLGQWVITSGRWCHQGGPWSAGLPTCSYEVWQPTYPAYHPRTWAGLVRG